MVEASGYVIYFNIFYTSCKIGEIYWNEKLYKIRLLSIKKRVQNKRDKLNKIKSGVKLKRKYRSFPY